MAPLICQGGTCLRRLRTTIAVAPESASWCSNSGAVYSGLVLTTTSPLRNAANIAIGYCSTFGSMIASRSPFASRAVFRRYALRIGLQPDSVHHHPLSALSSATVRAAARAYQALLAHPTHLDATHL